MTIDIEQRSEEGGGFPFPPLPVAGQEPWDADLNTCINALYEAANYMYMQIGNLSTFCYSLEGRIAGLENKPVFGYNSYSWQYSNGALPPTGNQVRMDNANPTLATMIEFRKIDNDGNDRSNVLMRLAPLGKVRISDWDDNTVYHTYNIGGAPTKTADTVQVPVVWQQGNGLIPNAKVEVELLVPF